MSKILSVLAINKNLQTHLRWSVDYDCDYTTDCSTYGCDCICRCSQIENLEIHGLDAPEIATQFVQSYNSHIKRTKTCEADLITSEIDVYCIDRILSRIEPDHLSADVSGGYYGEEINGFELDILFADNIAKLLKKKTIKDKIKFILTLEYGFVLPKLENAKFEIVEVDRADLQKSIANEHYYSKISIKDNHRTDSSLPIGIYEEKDENSFLIVDGYHRYIEHVMNGKNKKLKIIKACVQ